MLVGELLIGPITEEMIGRGIILAILLRYTSSGRWMALLISAFVFVACHMVRDIPEFFVLLGGGVLLGYAYMATKSVPFCILCHSMWNGVPYLPH
jgi:membrane protease YdiL (CAAX protease family)